MLPELTENPNKMIKVSVLYPKTASSRFDMDYYANRHVPMVLGMVGDACKGSAVEAGVCGTSADEPPAYAAMGHLYFESAEAFGAAFGPHAGAILGDIPNFTDVQPVIQLSEVVS